jgi:hypothetical protein
MGALSFPGERLETAIETELRSRFLGVFRTRLPRAWLDLASMATAQAPTYTTYDAWSRITRDEMARLPIRGKLPVYLWIERPLPGAIRRATWTEWVDHAMARPRLGPCPDTYVFDETMDWCVVYTHEKEILISRGLLLGTPCSLSHMRAAGRSGEGT